MQNIIHLTQDGRTLFELLAGTGQTATLDVLDLPLLSIEEKSVLIAHLCGATTIPDFTDMTSCLRWPAVTERMFRALNMKPDQVKGDSMDLIHQIPDFVNMLEAVAEAQRHLSTDQQVEYVRHLHVVAGCRGPLWRKEFMRLSARAYDRAGALVLCMKVPAAFLAAKREAWTRLEDEMPPENVRVRVLTERHGSAYSTLRDGSMAVGMPASFNPVITHWKPDPDAEFASPPFAVDSKADQAATMEHMGHLAGGRPESGQ